MLKMISVKLELMHDVDMYQFIEKGMRDGISYIANRYSAANNKYMKNYNKNKLSKYIMYLDANNLYGWAMSQSLPAGGIQWMEPSDVNLNKYNKDTNKGLILEVDLDFPKQLHDLFNDYPLAPEKKAVKKELSEYCKSVEKMYGISIGKVNKLITTLYDKKKYVIHHENLKHLSLGMKLKKIHRALEFNQSKWLKQYIDLST